MISDNSLKLNLSCPVKSQNAGLLISRGQGTHPTRIIDSHELILVKSGMLELWEEDQNFMLEEGQTLHLFPSRRHGSKGILPKGLEFYWIHFEVGGGTDSKNSDPENCIEIPQVNRLSRPEKLESLFRYFLDSQEVGDLSQESANLLVMLMLVEVERSSVRDTDNSDKVNTLAIMVNTYIRINFAQPISSGKISKDLGYNSDYLGRIYRKVYECTITQAIHQRRVERACSLLIDSDMTIEEISRRCGFSDADYFRRIFRRYKHITPIAFRNINARIHVNTP
jgi:AraC-like DNA-binding protein